MTSRIGLDCKLYRGSIPFTAGETFDEYTGTWTEMSNVRDVTLNLEKAEADITTRGNNGWRQTRGTLKDGSVEFEMIDDQGADFAAFTAVFLSGDDIALAVLNGDIATAGSEGLVGNFQVTNFSRSEPLEEAVTHNVTSKPSGENDWVTVTT